jgi:hypothetical protein
MAIGASKGNGCGNGRTFGYCFISVHHVENNTNTISNSVFLKLHISNTHGYLEGITHADCPHNN